MQEMVREGVLIRVGVGKSTYYTAASRDLRADETLHGHTLELKRARQSEDQYSELRILELMGASYEGQGRFRLASACYQEALEIAHGIRAPETEAQILAALSSVCVATGDLQEALDLSKRGSAIAQKSHDDTSLVRNLAAQGNACVGLGRLAEAIECHQKALRIAREAADVAGEAVMLGNLGVAYTYEGRFEEAVECHRRALAITRKDTPRAQAIALGNLATAHAAMGQRQKAIKYHQEALQIAREIGDRNSAAKTAWNLGLRYQEAGDLRRAVDLMQLMVDFEREIGHADAEKDAAFVQTLRTRLKRPATAKKKISKRKPVKKRK